MDGTDITTPGSISGIDTDQDGSVDLAVTWDAGADLADTDDSTVYFRITPNDGTVDGSTATSSAFTLDTLAPTTPSALTSAGSTSGSVSLTYPSAVTETNFTEYKIYYSTNSSVSESDTAITQSTDANLASRTFNGASTITISAGLSTATTYYFKLYAYDDYGHSSSSSTVSVATKKGASRRSGSGITINTPITNTDSSNDDTGNDEEDDSSITDDADDSTTNDETENSNSSNSTNSTSSNPPTSGTYSQTISKLVTQAELNLEEKLLNYYYLRYQIHCLSTSANPDSALCLDAKIDLIYSQKLTNKTKLDLSLTAEELTILKLRLQWPEKRYQTYCVHADIPADYCTSLKESLKKIYYFVGE